MATDKSKEAMKLAQNMDRLKPFVGGLGIAILRELTQDAFALAEQPAQRKPLTDEQICRLKAQIKGTLDVQFVVFARAIEAKLKERNT